MFYWIENDIQQRYVYAYKDISFEGYNRETCPQCGRKNAIAHYTGRNSHLLLEGRGTYPDFLQFCGAGNRLFIVSEKALNIFEQYGITGYYTYAPVTFDSSLVATNTKKMIVPDYFNLEIGGRIDLDLRAMHLKQKKKCATCGQFEWSRQKLDPMILDRTSWDGSDLCTLTSMQGFRICSEVFVRLVNDNKLSGFSFHV